MKGAASRHLARQAAQAAVVAGSSRQSTGQGQSMGDRQFMRQMATVLSIDAVGYSRLMAEDDEAALDAFHERSALITAVCEQHRGRMFGKAGDSLMAEFGNPVDAVRAAVDFQARLEELNDAAPDNRRMAFRVGINTGDVIVDGDLLFGHDVNIAARLQERAPANGVVISQTTFIQVAASRRGTQPSTTASKWCVSPHW